MLKCTVIVVGKMKEAWWRDAQEEYLRRLRPSMKIAVIEVEAESLGSTVTEARAMREEGARLLRRLPADAFVVALERTGRECSSTELATLLTREGDAGREIVFLIGGSVGLDDVALARADAKISLSRLTFIHEMARVIVLEQLYRATMIIAGRPYHR